MSYSPIYNGEGGWLDENRILPTSQHFIQVSFFVYGDTVSGNSEEFLTEDEKGRSVLVLPRYYIQSAEFDGVQIGARRGKISMIDPEGIWASCFNYIGVWKNANAAIPNMVIHFGWIGLRPSGGDTSYVQKIPAVLLKTGFGMNEEGIITIDIEFVENTERLLNSIKFNHLADLTLLNSEMNDNVKNKKIYEVLQAVVESDLVKKQLETFGIKVLFDQTYEDEHHAYGIEGDDIKIRLGDNLSEKINELIARSMPQEDPKKTFSYEMIGKIVEENSSGNDKDPPFNYVIKFGWASSPTDEALDNMTADEARDSMKKGEDELIEGPRLIWKKQSDSENEKTLISFDIDLKMLDFATSMMRGELDKKLSSFGEENWDKIAEAVDAMDKNNPLLTKDTNELAQWVKEQNNNPDKKPGDPLVGLDYDEKSGGVWFVRWRNREDRDIQQSVEEFNQILADTSNNVNNQIRTIIRNNVFKAKARIMGDPSLGTEFTMFKVVFNTDFSAVGQFAEFFNREWLLTKVTHKIEEGGYFTDIELMALPVSASSPSTGSGGPTRFTETNTG